MTLRGKTGAKTEIEKVRVTASFNIYIFFFNELTSNQLMKKNVEGKWDEKKQILHSQMFQV